MIAVSEAFKDFLTILKGRGNNVATSCQLFASQLLTKQCLLTYVC